MTNKGWKLLSREPTKGAFDLAKSLKRFGYESKVTKSGRVYYKKTRKNKSKR